MAASAPEVSWTRYDEMDYEYRKFIAANPESTELFERFTFEKLHQGFKRYGAKDICARIRWETDGGDVGRLIDGFKVNDHHATYFARDLVARYPTLAGFFEERVKKSKCDPPRRPRPLDATVYGL